MASDVPHPTEDRPMVFFMMFLKVLLVAYLLNRGPPAPVERISECIIPSSPSEDRRLDSSSLTISTFNVEWLFYNPDQISQCDDLCTWKSPQQALSHLIQISQVLYDLNSDIVSLNEVEDCQTLSVLLEKFQNVYKPYLILGDDHKLKQNVGLLSRIDPKTQLEKRNETFSIENSESNCGEFDVGTTTSFLNKHLIARFSIPNFPDFTLISVHLKSGPVDSFKCLKREAQAKILNKIVIDEINKGQEVIVLGDLNDYDPEVLDVNDHVPISNVLQIIKTDTTQNKQVLWNVLRESGLPKTQLFSHWWDANKNCIVEDDELSLLDHFLVTEKLKNKIEKVEIVKTENTCGSMLSDHHPIKVTFSSNKPETSITSP